jgi:hypothetical protein
MAAHPRPIPAQSEEWSQGIAVFLNRFGMAPDRATRIAIVCEMFDYCAQPDVYANILLAPRFSITVQNKARELLREDVIRSMPGGAPPSIKFFGELFARENAQLRRTALLFASALTGPLCNAHSPISMLSHHDILNIIRPQYTSNLIMEMLGDCVLISSASDVDLMFATFDPAREELAIDDAIAAIKVPCLWARERFAAYREGRAREFLARPCYQHVCERKRLLWYSRDGLFSEGNVGKANSPGFALCSNDGVAVESLIVSDIAPWIDIDTYIGSTSEFPPSLHPSLSRK